jgi:PAS domain S-box-containing protein
VTTPQPDDQNLTSVADAAESILVIENAPLPLLVILPDGRVALANRALCDFLGYDSGELVGVDVRTLVAADSDDEFRRRWDYALTSRGVTSERAARLRRRDGESLAARVASLVVADADGAPRFVIARALVA